MIGVASAIDPYLLIPVDTVQGIKAAPAMRDPRLKAGERTGVFGIPGQSNATNITDAAYVPVNGAKIDNLDINDGGLYVAADPLLGCTTNLAVAGRGNIFTRVADKLISAGVFDRVILIPVAVGGTPVASWVPGALGDRILVAARRARAVGLPITAFLWMQGETDGVNGTSQATYAATLASVIAGPRAEGFNAPWFIGKCTYIVGTVYPAIQAAQAGIVNPAANIFAGANTDSLTGATYRQVIDDTHLNGTAGSDAASTLWTTAIDAVF